MAAPRLLEQTTYDQSDRPRVELDDVRSEVRIHGLTCSAPEVYGFLARKRAEVSLENELIRCIEVGVSVLGRMETASDMDFVDAKVSALTERFNHDLESLKGALLEELEKRFNPHHPGSYTDMVNTFFGTKRDEFERLTQQSLKGFGTDQINLKRSLEEFAQGLAAKLDPNHRGSFFSELIARLEERFGRGGDLERLFTERLSLEKEDSPLSRFLVRVERGFTEVRKEIAEYKAAMETRGQVSAITPIKGKDLEADVFQVLSTIAKPFNGDHVEDVRTVAGPTGSKIGDFVYHVAVGGSVIAIEARNEPLSSLPKALRSMEEAKSNRRAQYAVYVAGDETQLQAQTGQWSEFDGDKAVTHVGLLDVAIKVARARLVSSAATGEGIDVAAVAKELAAATRALKKLSTVKGEATGIKAAAERIHELTEDIKAQVEERLSAVDTAITKNAKPSTLTCSRL